MYNLGVFSKALVLAGVFMFVGYANSAFAQGQCGIGIEKVAFGGAGTQFPFEVTVDGNGPNSAIITAGDGTGGPFSSSVIVTELPLEGWELVDIECEGEGGISFDIADDGFTAECNGSGGGTCTFFNRPVSAIPTLSEWGMISAAVGLGLIGLFFAVRRTRAV